MHNIPVGISSCLLGHEVRYDGAHKYHSYIERTLGRYFDFKPFCPEVEAGLGIPAPAYSCGKPPQASAASASRTTASTSPSACRMRPRARQVGWTACAVTS